MNRAVGVLIAGILLAVPSSFSSDGIPGAPSDPYGASCIPAACVGDDAAVVLEEAKALSLRFDENLGQYESPVRYVTRTGGATVFFTPAEVVTVLQARAAPHTHDALGSLQGPPPFPIWAAPASPAVVVRMQFIGANPAPVVTGEDLLPGISNYYLGNDPARWATGVPGFARIRYADVWPGIDLVYYANAAGALEYDFVLAPDTDPGAVRFTFTGADAAAIVASGSLVLSTPLGELRHAAPVSYQENTAGQRLEVESAYALDDTGSVGFWLASYDRTRPLVIDPVLVYSTYVGGSSGDSAEGVAVDLGGNAIITGYTFSVDYPTLNPSQAANAGPPTDAFVTKLTSTGTLAYSTYLGGSSEDRGRGVAVDGSGNAIVTGQTLSTDYPTLNPSQPAKAGYFDAFVTKLTGTGALVYSTYLGGTGINVGKAVAGGSDGDAVVTGDTTSTDFPTLNPAQPTKGGTWDAFVTKFTSAGAIAYSTYLGGSSGEAANGVAVDSNGHTLVTGSTFSTNFPTLNAVRPTYAGNEDAFVTKLTSAGAVAFSTYLGGYGYDRGHGIAVDSKGNAVIAGSTASSNFPTMNASQPTNRGVFDTFITKLTSTGSLVYSTYLGGSWTDYGTGVAVDSGGNATITGWTGSLDFPTLNPSQSTHPKGDNAFVSKFTTSGAQVYSTYAGGCSHDYGNAVAVDSGGNAIITGSTSSTGFPTLNPFQPTNPGGDSAFVTKVTATGGLDEARPTTCLESRIPAANANGWNKGSVTSTWSCSDAFSTVIAFTVRVTVSTEGAGQSATGTCQDLAGNTASSTVSGINIDKTPPTSQASASCAVPGTPPWCRGSVTFTSTASDALSGIASKACKFDGTAVACGTVVSTTDGTHKYEIAATDRAGNSAGASVTGYKDATPPTGTITSPAISVGRYTVSWTASDATSGLAAALNVFEIGPVGGLGLVAPETLVCNQAIVPGTLSTNGSCSREPSPGQWCYRFEVRDVAGNLLASSSTCTVKV